MMLSPPAGEILPAAFAALAKEKIVIVKPVKVAYCKNSGDIL